MIRINIPMTDAIEDYESQSRCKMEVMQVAPQQAAFLQFLVTLLRTSRVFEIGTFTGCSAMAIALSSPEGNKGTTSIMIRRSSRWPADSCARPASTVGDRGPARQRFFIFRVPSCRAWIIPIFTPSRLTLHGRD